ncbi:P-loop containing nucleoside triphosphate hydrolase protein [Gonapodya prolifera JEL478]|uniref:p-loop containing nucleoside triphosphate hydrolase protein n=1 Tax=Gonapodya prolifera (strain JEL478) TaxID=1344416 RepID=A0A139AZ27_GONPJ|nr:P-loop containing nucleoside triphosphate hydrolase protein [Gonapodya prolifera JEL478]|eukprot:KXS21960.1 P-loop containing nucleoside triphosphate hydrolase protein [Gonapodya prolifera JEL478]
MNKADSHTLAPDSHTKDVLLTTEQPASHSAEPANQSDAEKAGETPVRKVSLLGLYRFATSLDWFLIIVGIIASATRGVIMPVTTLLLGNLADGVNSSSSITYDAATIAANPQIQAAIEAAKDSVRSTTYNNIIMFTILGAISFVAGYLQDLTLTVTAERQLKTVREKYFGAILRQDIGWFEENMTGDLTSRLQADTALLKSGFGERVGNVAMSVAQFIAGIVLAYVRGWKMALVISGLIPLSLVIVGIMGVFLRGTVAEQQAWLAKAGSVAQQTLTSIRTVHSFGGFEKEVRRYGAMLDKATGFGSKIGVGAGIAVGTLFMVIYGFQGLGFWYAATLINVGEMTGGTALSVFLALQIGMFGLATLGGDLSQITISQGAAAKIWDTIDRESPIDAWKDEGLVVESGLQGDIVFSDVCFEYKSRPGQKIIDTFNLSVKRGTKVALVGASGSGKSTIVKLLMRFYDPVSGSLKIDGHELKDFNVRWLRQQIGSVGQEPALFEGSIRSNILMGLADPAAFSASELDIKIHRALKFANADFVLTLPAGLDTMVGERGAMLSGGQKQRIAIARAIVGDPKILLFDEATSALDTASERVVQAAIDSASKGRTSFTVAHRLSTIMNSDIIVVMKHGVIVEQGTHTELLAKGGQYAKLVQAQRLHDAHSDTTEDGEDAENEDKFVEISEMEDGEGPEGAGPVDEEKAANRPRRLSRVVSLKAVSERVGSTRSIGRRGSAKASQADIAKAFEEARKEELRLQKLEKKKYKHTAIPWGLVIRNAMVDWRFVVVGSVAAAIAGAVMPIVSILLSRVLSTFAKTGDALMNEAKLYAILFFAVGVVQLIVFALNLGAWGITGERFSQRMRMEFFSVVIRQEVAFFDESDNNVGSLTARLADDATQVKSLFNDVLSAGFNIMGCLIAGLIISFINGWKYTLILFVGVPLLIGAQFVQSSINKKHRSLARTQGIETNKIANESISQIRTVAMLTKEKLFWDLYRRDLVAPYKEVVHGSFRSAIPAGFAAAMQMWFLAYAYYMGINLVLNGEYTGDQLQACMFAMLFTAMSIGNVAGFGPSLSNAQVSAAAVYSVILRSPAMDQSGSGGSKPVSASGQAQYTDVHFAYPTRVGFPVLKGISIEAKPGETVALVGPSGSGKSSTIGLIQRYYDVTSGTVALDGMDVKTWSLPDLRERMALVGQEPVLFAGTIAENIAYGLPEGQTATQEQIQAAAKLANAYNFIMEQKDGFETNVGESGSLLSGGQKQRIAIARALIRDPKVLLLDEATSALDSESEKVVQSALDDASKGRTTIVIAHRLSSIQNANRIYVIKAGEVEEFGTHEQLLEKKGLYWELAQQQSLGQ